MRNRTAILAGLFILAAVGCGEMRPPGQKQYLIRHTVEQGDTLYSIAWRYGQDYREVAAWNHIDAPYTIYEGEELLIIPPNRYSGPRELPDPPAPPVASTAPARHWPAPRSLSTVEALPKSAPVKATSSAPSVSRTRPRPRSLPQPVHVASGIDWGWPTRGKVTSSFSLASGKKGVEIAGESGQPVRAAAPGDVVYSGDGLIGYGNLLIIKHDEHYLSAYGHNKKLLVKEGDKVKKGQEIARMGQTRGSGSILYFEIRRGGKPVDPMKYLPSRRL